MRAALVQLTSGHDPALNLAATRAAVARAAEGGADLVTTPEVTNFISVNPEDARGRLFVEDEDPTLGALREDAARHGIWLHVGSLALRSGDADGRLANRSVLIGPDGSIAARYDKIHMFDVAIDATETYRESDRYRPGDRAVLARTPMGTIGLTVCYDVRFARLYRDLARAGAGILMVPAAFSPVSGAAHWEPLLRARAIETGCFVLAAAQTGRHVASDGRERRTHGHSLAVSPWGEVLVDAGTEPGVTFVDLDPADVDRSRARIPSLGLEQDYAAP
ncbi:carbon-nitrogen hydrolase family protein [Palleronia sp. LCG004]|uniref:carbon-nitrogen hydrolase family protein n=1 Tax=Palleronia sp. LCG004 TaxID=3079304 RepID=UPI002943CE61|nr:carbon-nitrogen hydrolase family protein [Palleronia sp. LCG004]WOI55975.1 carbon-nitrogen hydrolase family protein [Palleronia sp. LCG004]